MNNVFTHPFELLKKLFCQIKYFVITTSNYTLYKEIVFMLQLINFNLKAHKLQDNLFEKKREYLKLIGSYFVIQMRIRLFQRLARRINIIHFTVKYIHKFKNV